jgi:DNA polymerase alpha subunit A
VDSGMTCPNPDCASEFHPTDIENQVHLALRRHIETYMQCYCVCDEKACGALATSIAVYGRRCQMPGCKGTLIPEVIDAFVFSGLGSC